MPGLETLYRTDQRFCVNLTAGVLSTQQIAQPLKRGYQLARSCVEITRFQWPTNSLDESNPSD